jgi:hypothetical protein
MVPLESGKWDTCHVANSPRVHPRKLVRATHSINEKQEKDETQILIGQGVLGSWKRQMVTRLLLKW